MSFTVLHGSEIINEPTMQNYLKKKPHTLVRELNPQIKRVIFHSH